jgi:hypothetical protein
MGYSNINATPNYQLQGFGQSGMRTISTSQAYVEGEYYRVLVATQDSTISATSVIGDDITDLQVYAGTTIYGLFTAVSVSVGEVTAYLAGATDIESVWSYINTYGLNNGAIIEAADCAKDAIEPLLDKYYAQASLVLVPSLYKTSVVYAERPLDANGQLTFTRASEATRVGPDGYVEKVRTNLLLQSNQFDTTWLNQLGGTITSGQAGYDGTNDAWLLSKDTSTFRSVRQVISSSGLQTFSAYLKAGTLNKASLRIDASTAVILDFDLSNGTFISSSGTFIGYKIISIGSGWYRISVLYNDSNTNVHIYPDRAGTTAGNILVQDAQLEVGDIATDYIPTTTTAVSVGPVNNLPRLNYPINADGSVGCPSLLLEPQRTNLLQFSEQFDNSYFTKGASSITANAAISPSGYQDADKLVPDTSNAIHSVYRSSQPITGGTYSVFAKADGYNWILLTSHSSLSPAARGAFFNVGNGTIGTAAAGINAKIENYGNGWYRCSINEGVSASSLWTVIPTNADKVTTFEGNGTDGVLIWGGQNEQGSYATSYIPTLGASVTRVADICNKTGISSLIGQTEGTIFWEGMADGNLASTNLVCFDFAVNSVYITKQGNNIIRAGVQQPTGSFNLDSTAVFGKFKVAIAYKNGDSALYLNGALAQASTNAISFTSSLTQLNLGVGISFFAAVNKSECSQALLFKTRLTNQQLQELTSL